MRRSPAVAGQFYHGNAAKLSQQVAQYIDRSAKKERVIGAISPHAGLMYSGSVAGAVYSAIEFPDTFVLLGPNHTGLGTPVSLMESGEWEIPTGMFEVDKVLSHKIAMHAPVAAKDSKGHMFEHSLEVQLPFIAYFRKQVKIVPITILTASLDECRLLGEGIAKAVKEVTYPVVLIASSDMSHYVTDTSARQKDRKAIDRMLSLDPEGLFETVARERISMCGYLPATATLFAAKALGARSARLVKYTTSGEVSGDYDQVVGYAGIVLR
ncbi:MAG: AmmeMemoRadiSam system protein B [Nitrospirota bacterium]